MKTIKKIIAIGTGALMLGATLGGAYAQTLAEFPSPFIEDGRLNDTVIVVGEEAATSDVVGAIDIAASLQANAISPVNETDGGQADPTISEGVRVSRAGNEFNYGERIQNIQTVYDDEDLPDLLFDAELEDEEYTQTLTLVNSTFTFDSPGEVDETEFDAGSYLLFEDGDLIYTYELEMEDTLNFDELESETLEIMGNTYTITDFTTGANGQITQIELQVGETTRTLVADEPVDIGEDTVTLISVNEDEDQCYINVNGVPVTIEEGETEEVDGLEIGMTDAFAGNQGTAALCTVNIGARALVLNDGGRVEVNDETIRGSTAQITGNGTDETFDGFTITYSMNDDDFEEDMYGLAQYRSPGEEWTDPIFGGFKVVFAGVSRPATEEMDFRSDGEEATFSFLNTERDEVEVPFFISGSNIVAGEDADSPLLFGNGTVSSSANEPILWFVLSNGEVHLLQFDEFDDDNNEITFLDLVDDNEYTTRGAVETDTSPAPIELGTLGTIEISYSGGTLYFNPTDTPAESYYGAEIEIIDGTDDSIQLVAPEDDSEVLTDDNVFNLTMSIDADDDEINIDAPEATHWIAQGEDREFDNDDIQVYVDPKGTYMEYDSDENDFLDIRYPEEDVYGVVFVSPREAEVRGGVVGDGETGQVNPFTVGLAVLDTDAENMDSNMIVVGGPCANTVAADLLGVSENNCGQGFQPGRAILRLFDREGNTALLVAGYDAQDTLNAAYVLAQHNDYEEFDDLGRSVELVVQDIEDVGFNTVTTGGTTGNRTNTTTPRNTTGNATRNTTNTTR